MRDTAKYATNGSAAQAESMAENDRRNPNQRGPMVALVVVALLFVIGWLLAHELYAGSKMEDCLLSGRTNCAPIDGASR